MTDSCKTCGKEYRVRVSSIDAPYHYTESGLPDIRLINIPVYSCCGVESADIPNMDKLHKLIAQDLILTPRPMSGLQLRFLRKEAKLKPQDVADRFGIDPKTPLNWEKMEVVSRQADLIMRVLVTAELWHGAERAKILDQLSELARYAWETEEVETEPEQENVEADIAQLASDNVAYGLNPASHQWNIIA
jgi:DNA-binding transcriptional regulator YiaG